MKFDAFVILFHSFTIPSLNVSAYLVILIIGLVKSASKFNSCTLLARISVLCLNPLTAVY